MAKVYLSSTYADLSEARETVYRALRRLGHDVIAMENYVATDERPVDKCLADVRESDIYVGLIAWRYGYVPPNMESSITELEFHEAARLEKPCLLFLIDEGAPWPRKSMDRDSQRIEALREEMTRDYMISYFRTIEELAALVNTAVANVLSKGRPSFGLLQIADIVISGHKSVNPTIDIKLFNPSDTVIFLASVEL
jgi:hypothetical protein